MGGVSDPRTYGLLGSLGAGISWELVRFGGRNHPVLGVGVTGLSKIGGHRCLQVPVGASEDT